MAPDYEAGLRNDRGAFGFIYLDFVVGGVSGQAGWRVVMVEWIGAGMSGGKRWIGVTARCGIGCRGGGVEGTRGAGAGWGGGFGLGGVVGLVAGAGSGAVGSGFAAEGTAG